MSSLRSQLAEHRLLGVAPPEELDWLIAHGVPRTFDAGDVTTYKGKPEEWLHVLLTGHIAIHLDRGAGSRKIITWRAGDVLGLMPYSRGGAPPGDTVAEEPTETLAIHRDRIPEMIQACPFITATLVHSMLDRARHFTSSDLHDEKLISLGKLAAGLAHELNNPASAAARGAKRLAASLDDAERAARDLAVARVSPAQLAVIDGVRALCAPVPAHLGRSPMDRADREDAIAGWLHSQSINDAIAAPLAETSVTLAALQTLAAALPGDALDATLRGLAAGCAVRSLASDIDVSASRVSELVGAVKGFTYMDRAPTLESVDVGKGIADTLAVLRATARRTAVAITVSVAPDLPRVQASGAELNQVWANLIDNAVAAAAASGHVSVSATRELDRVVVRVIDDGPGIPPEIQGRIFDPFFTTKGVGEGTGLGLDIVRRLVQRHDGEIEFTSQPGRTEFRVSLAAQLS